MSVEIVEIEPVMISTNPEITFTILIQAIYSTVFYEIEVGAVTAGPVNLS